MDNFATQHSDKEQQALVGETRAIYELTKMGYTVSKPLRIHCPYDLIVDKNNCLERVQVKTSSYKSCRRHQSDRYEVHLQTTGGNSSKSTRKPFDATAIDALFIMVADGRCWLIPSSEIKTSTTLTIGTKRYDKYQITGKTPSAKEEALPPIEPCLPSNSVGREIIIDRVAETAARYRSRLERIPTATFKGWGAKKAVAELLGVPPGKVLEYIRKYAPEYESKFDTWRKRSSS